MSDDVGDDLLERSRRLEADDALELPQVRDSPLHVLEALGVGFLVRDVNDGGVAVRLSANHLGEAIDRHLEVGTDVEHIAQRRGLAQQADESFDHLTFTYLLRYVDDPGATLRELARVVRPGGTVAMLEFGIPHGLWRPLWSLHVRIGLPLAGRLLSPGWHEVGRFLGGSIRDFHGRYPEPALLELWSAAGIEHAQARRLSLGGGLVVWGRRS